MIASVNQKSVSILFCSLWDLLKVLMFLLNLNGFNSSPSPLVQGFTQRKCSSKMRKEKSSKWFYHFFSLSLLVFVFALLVCFAFKFWVSLLLCFALFNMFLYVFSFVYFVFHTIFFFFWKIRKIQKQCVCVYWYLGTMDDHWNKVF